MQQNGLKKDHKITYDQTLEISTNNSPIGMYMLQTQMQKNNRKLSFHNKIKSNMNNVRFPSENEYPAYASMYMKCCNPEQGLQTQLMESLKTTKQLIAGLSNDALNYSYSKGKWTLKEILVHLLDDERIYAYRSLAFARNDKTLFPGFEQDAYVINSFTSERHIDNIMEEYEAVRIATVKMYDGFSKEALNRTGTADGNMASVRALGFHILGHELHHVNIIKTHYLKNT